MSLENYYKHFELGQNGLTFSEMFNAFTENRGRFPTLFARLADQKPLNILVLGSAAKRNIDDLTSFLRVNRKNISHDEIRLLDKTAIILPEQTDPVPSSESPRIVAMKGDMNAMPLRNRSANLVLADFTLNLNSDFRAVGRTVENISQTLENQGLFLGSIATGLENEAITAPNSRGYIEDPFPRTYFPLKSLQALALKAGLYPRGDQVCKPKQSSNIEVTYFLMQKLEARPKEVTVYNE